MKVLVVVLMLASLTGCLKTRSQLKDDGTGNMRTDASGTYVAGNMGQQQRAQIDSRFFEIDRDFRELYGKIEVLEKKMNDSQSSPEQAVAPTTAASDQKVMELEKRIGTLEEALLALDKKLGEVSGGKKTASIQTLKKKSPKGPFATGELFYKTGKYADAIQSYDSYRKRYPRGKRYAQATLKMGMAFQELKMNQDAKAFYKEVIQRYPKTKVAIQAQKNLKRL